MPNLSGQGNPIHAGPNPKYFGIKRGITWYNLVSDHSAGLSGIPVPGTLRDSMMILALLLEQELVEDALAVYRADLGLDDTLNRPSQHPENVWSLHGYVECLRRLGRDADVATIQPRLDLALARADVPIHASCFCRLEEECCGCTD